VKRTEFIRHSAIIGASLALPRTVYARSGMFAVSGERRVSQVLNSKRTMVQNVPVLRAFGGGEHDLVSPFVMLDEFGPFQVNPGDIGMDIKAHPHAGVVPTTFLVQGSGRHTDSINNDIVYREGQFMLFSSGRGAIHEEVSDDQLRKDGGTVQGFQIWLNLPANEKFRNPETFLHNSDALPVIENEGHRIQIMMGDLQGKASPVETHSPAFYYHIKLEAGHRLDIPVKDGNNAFIYVVKGVVELENRTLVAAAQLALYERQGETLRYYSETGCEFLVLGGNPLDEPFYSYGPFVMNTPEQIELCFQNYRAGKMGEL
jgi:redox-sensitive bicupin YhaK (pirin superfamily)